MKQTLLEFLICPSCLPNEIPLHIQTMDMDGSDVISGGLRCGQCGMIYPITEGVALLVPPQDLLNNTPSKYESPSVVSSYLWSHYGDLFDDTDAAHAYTQWAGLMEPGTGMALDAGCSVGRFTFELSRKSDFAVGVDLSHAFIKQARKLLLEGCLHVPLALEGSLTREKTLRLDKEWNIEKVEFLVADVQALPFKRSCFRNLSSLNLIDKIPLPLLHLKEMNRVAGKEDAQFLFSDPFSWSTDITREENWLGGVAEGPFPGYGEDNVASLLKGKGGDIHPPWEIRSQGHIWWKIRNHRNHFELIRSCFLHAFR